MRAYKKLWAEFANSRGYLERDEFGPFFAVSLLYHPLERLIPKISLQRLSGVFEVKIYPTEFSKSNLKATCSNLRHPMASSPDPYDLKGLDLKKVANALGRVDPNAIKKRKNIYSRLYHEAIISHRPGVGISFTDMLLLLAHHKLIVDGEALV